MESQLELQKANRERFDQSCNVNFLGSWCDDRGGSTGALVARVQTGNGAFCKHETLAEGSGTAHLLGG